MVWRYRNTVLVVAAYGFFAVQAARFALSPVVPNILDTFSISKGAVGLALTGMWASYALLQYPGGMLGDRFDERRILLLALGTVGVGTLAVAVAPVFVVFAGVVVLLGAGAGMYFPVAASLTTDLFEREGQVLGSIAAASSVAGMLSPAVATVVAARYGWRVAIALVGVLVVPAVILLVWRVRPRASPRPTQSLRQQLDPATVRELLTRPPIVFTLVVAIGLSFVFQSVLSFLPTFLVEYRSFPIQTAGLAFSGMYLLSAVGQVVMGRVSDILTRDTAIIISTTSSIVGIGTLLGTTGYRFALVGVAFLGLGLSVGGVMNARFVDNFSDDERGFGLGLVRLIFLLVSSSGNVITGVLADTAGWPVAYGLVVGLLMGVVVVLGTNRLLDMGL